MLRIKQVVERKHYSTLH